MVAYTAVCYTLYRTDKTRRENICMSIFNLGRCVITQGIAIEISKNPLFAVTVKASFNKHRNGDWGDISDNDKRANDKALTTEDRIVSSYETGEGDILIITEWDRSATTIMFADEY